MATIPAPSKAPASAKYDAQVSAQLAKAERRVRFLDLATGLLSLLALSLAFAALMVVLHWKLQLSLLARQVSLVVYLLGAGAFLTWKVLLPWRRPLNPRFAALQLERTLPGSKNSVVNYLDLRNEQLPPAIRGALSRRAAKDALHADIEQAIPGRNVGKAGGLAVVVAILCIALMFAVGSRDFFRLLGGVLAPVTPTVAGPVAPTNRVSVRLPEGGNATLAAGSALAIAARVEGVLPPGAEQAPTLILRYPQSKDVAVRPLHKPRRPGGDWTAEVTALEVRDGFTYKVTAGDAESPEYRVSVYFAPVVTKFQAVYQYPAYVGEPRIKVQIDNRRLQAWRGSAVSLRVQTNGAVKDAEIELTAKDPFGKEERKTLPATVAVEDREAFEVAIAPADFEKYSHYRLSFTPERAAGTANTEPYHDQLAYELIADPDNPPHPVELARPEKETLPANALLKVQGAAADDIGVKSLTLRWQRLDGDKSTKLKEKPYRSDAELRLPGGGYLKTLAYKDVVDLKTAQGADGKPVTLKAGDVLEYWLEARDACDYPRPKDHTESEHYRIKLTAPQQDPQQQQKDRASAQEEQKEHQAKQDEERRQEDQKRKDEQKDEEARKNQQAGASNSQPKPNEKKGQNPESQPNGAQKNENPSDKPDEKASSKGDGKGDQPKPGASKPADAKQDGNQAEQQQKNKGDGKPKGKEDGDKKPAGQCKECQNPGGQGGAGKESGQNEPKGDGKDGSSTNSTPMGQGGDKPGAAKDDAAPKPSASAAKSGAGKGGAPKESGGAASPGKTGASAQTDPEKKPHGKEAGSAGQASDEKAAGAAKSQPSPDTSAASAKQDDGQQGKGNEGQAKANDSKAGPSGQGAAKSDPGQQTASAKPDPSHDVSKIDAKNPALDDLRKLMKNLGSHDEEQVGKALKKLEEIGDKSENPQAREFAKKLTDDLKKFIEQKQQEERTQAGKPKSSTKPADNPSTSKGSPGKSPKDSGTAKEARGEPTANKGSEKGPGRPDQVGNPMTPPEGLGEKQNPTKPTVKGPLNPLGRRDDTTEVRNPEDPLKPGEPINPLTKRDTTLQLEKFDPKKYQNQPDKTLSKVKPPRTDPKTTPPGTPEKVGPNTGGSLPSFVGRPATDPKAPATGSSDTDRAAPPPGYRNTVSEFTKIRAQPESVKPEPK